jgi:hypothetical protein
MFLVQHSKELPDLEVARVALLEISLTLLSGIS